MNKRNYKDEVSELSEEIKMWYYNSQHKNINVITHPYNGIDIFSGIIEEIVKNKGKVLYIGKDINLVRKQKFFYNNNEENVFLKSTKEIPNIKGKYDLIIYDDITAFSSDSRAEILEKIEWIYNKGKKLILYSIEKIFYNTPVLEFYSLENRNVLVEPRVITTRVNVGEEIPYLFYDYIKWFYKENRKVILYVETSNEREKVFKNYKKALKDLLNMKVYEYNSLKMNKEYFEEKISNSKEGLMIIADLKRKDLISVKNMDIIMVINKNTLISYKELLYFCGIVSKCNEIRGEVLLVCNDEIEKIDKVKYMAREFNRKLWEKGFLKA